MTKLVQLLGGFTLLQALGYVAPFAALPVVARAAGESGWVHIAAAQSIGTLTAVVILFGWWTAGPAEYHSLATARDRITLYRRSFYERVLIASVAVPVSLVIVAAIAPGEWLVTCILVDIAMASAGLTPSWLFVASGSPIKLALYETIPRSGAMLASIGAVLALSRVWPYPVIQLLAVCVSYSVCLRRESPRRLANQIRLRALLSELRTQLPIALSNILGALYSQLSVPVAASVAAPAVAAPYATGDKLYRASRFTIDALGNTFQSWVLATSTRRRHLVALCSHTVFGLVGGGAIAGLMPIVSATLFGSTLHATYAVSGAFGLAFFATSVTTPIVRNVLIPNGHRRLPLLGTSLAATVGLAGIFPLHSAFGVAGIAFAVAVSEVTNAVTNGTAAWVIIRRLPGDVSSDARFRGSLQTS